MTESKQEILKKLRLILANDTYWSKRLANEDESTFSVHLAIMREPYLGFLMDGKKTIESRFAKRACPPFQRVSENDIVLLKRSAGDIVGVCSVTTVWFYQIDPASFTFIKMKFGKAICPANEDFWEERSSSRVATLMLVEAVTKIEGISVKKRDRRGWAVFRDERQQSLL